MSESSGLIRLSSAALAAPPETNSGVTFIDLSPALETFNASGGAFTYVADAVSDSTRASQDFILGFGEDDGLVLSALPFTEIVLTVANYNATPGSLLLRQINQYTVVNYGGWLDDAFQMRVEAPLDRVRADIEREAPGLLSLSVPEWIQEGSQAVGTVFRDGPTTTTLTVSLASSDVTEAVVPETVTIPAGQNSARFVISALEDFEPDGDQSVIITAATAGASAASADLIVRDGNLGFTFINLTADQEVFVVGMGDTFVIDDPADSTRAAQDFIYGFYDEDAGRFVDLKLPGLSFDRIVYTVEDYNAMPTSILLRRIGEFTVVNHGGWAPGAFQLRIQGLDVVAAAIVSDFDSALTLSISPAAIPELGGVATATVTRNNPTDLPLTVFLSSSDVSEAAVPATVVIPAGEASATFDVAAVNDGVADGDQWVEFRAFAPGFGSGGAPAWLLVEDIAAPPVTTIVDLTAAQETLDAFAGPLAYRVDAASDSTRAAQDFILKFGEDDFLDLAGVPHGPIVQSVAAYNATPGSLLLRQIGAYTVLNHGGWRDDDFQLRVEAPLHRVRVIIERDVPGEATTLSTLVDGVARRGPIDVPGDDDWFRFNVAANKTYRFDLTPDGQSTAPLEDPFLRLYNAGGAEIAHNDDGGDGLNARLFHIATEDTVLFVSAGASSYGIGDYTLEVAPVDP